MNSLKYLFWELRDEVRYWVYGRPTYGSYYIPVDERIDYLWCIVSNKFRRAFYCPLGKHYVKWNSGDPKCIVCNKRYNEIFK